MDEHRPRRPATIYDVAALAGVSHQTVSRLIAGHSGIRPATRDKVEAAIDELEYRTNVMARNLRTGRTGMISFAIPSLNQPYYAELAQHVITAARAHGLTVFVETTEGDAERERALVSGDRGRLVDGIIYAPLALGSKDLAEVDPSSPLVLVGDRILDSPFDHVTLPNAAASRAAVEHLIALGRRRIAVVGVESPSDYGAATQRLRGYREAIDDAGIAFDQRLTAVAGEWLRLDGMRAVERLVASGIPFDSIFCFNDALALGALRALLTAGIRVPDDVAVIGFDDTEDAQYSTPSLSSISPGSRQLAEMAVDLLARKVKDPTEVQPADLVTDFELLARESTVGARSPRGGLRREYPRLGEVAPE